MARFKGTEGNDYLNFDGEGVIVQARGGNDEVVGTLNNDVLWGATGDDALYGAGGADRLMGGAGDDIVVSVPFKGNSYGWVHSWGGSGDDIVNMVNGEADGGRGNDVLTGSMNGTADGIGTHAVLTGGGGADVFEAVSVHDGVFSNTDVLDFNPAEGDRLAFYDDTAPGGNPEEVEAATWAKLDANRDGLLNAADPAVWAAGDGSVMVVEMGGDGNVYTYEDAADRSVYWGHWQLDATWLG
jgi:Ca2+-binding RTX toxin-like protein